MKNIQKALILLFSTQVLNAAVFETCTQGVLFDNRNTYKNISGVVVCHLRDNPTLKTREVGLYKGVKQGKTTVYAASLSSMQNKSEAKNLYKIEYYSNGKLDGEIKYFDPNSGEQTEFKRLNNGYATYVKNIKTGEEKFYAYPLTTPFWSESGSMIQNSKGEITSLACPQKKSDSNIINTKCGFSSSPGPLVKLHYGTEVHEMHYCKGRPCGNRKSSYTSGEKSSEIFVNKEEQRVEREYHKDGTIASESISDKGLNTKRTVRENFDNGKTKSLSVFMGRKVVELTLYFQNGSMKYHGVIEGKIVKVEHYYDTGVKSEMYEFKKYPSIFFNRVIQRGKLINTSYSYFESGKIYRELTWNNGVKLTMQEYDEVGNILKKEQYYEDGSRKLD